MMEDSTRRIVMKKVYALMLKSERTYFLSVQAAYSLEEAFDLAKREFVDMNPVRRGNNSLEGAEIGLFAIKTLDELSKMPDPTFKQENSQIQAESRKEPKLGSMLDFFEDEFEKRGTKYESIVPAKPKEKKMVEIDAKDAKNMIMKEIVDKKDRELFEQNRGMFSAAECAYLEKRLQ